ncbi:hypothetical protein M9H77_24219 [Catharanthus roseus]|uniref:Uncharacterized protein n=1 Tax=Catharanthus roseus TaxID=4058 RepID=A0ACC0AWF3_CATRO|nr:hypothetical protein M9H77_24219 [Catharanthus roseus]
MEGPTTLPFDYDNQNSMVATAGAGGGGASNFLANLPSRGLFSSTVLSSNPGGMRVYICDHETSPPEDQLIKTNQTNILIRSLMLKKQKGDSSSKDGKVIAGKESSRKRAAEKALDGRGKRASTSTETVSRQDGSKPHLGGAQKDLQNLTVERLRALLREKGLSLRGRKASIWHCEQHDELIARLRAATE